MLVLTRRTNESVMIGKDITVTVLGVKGNQVRIGVAAPKEIPVHREEIYFQIMEERRLAPSAKPIRIDPPAGEAPRARCRP